MGFLNRLLGRSEECQGCLASAKLVRTFLPDGSRLYLCPDCRREADEVFADPIADFEFGRMVEEMDFTSNSVWGIPWRATREEILALVPAQYAARFAAGRSPALLRNDGVALAGRLAAVTFVLNAQGRLKEVHVAPKQAVLNAVRPLVEQLGSPLENVQGFEADEIRVIWHHDELEFDLSYDARRLVDLAVRTERRF